MTCIINNMERNGVVVQRTSVGVAVLRYKPPKCKFRDNCGH